MPKDTRTRGTHHLRSRWQGAYQWGSTICCFSFDHFWYKPTLAPSLYWPDLPLRCWTFFFDCCLLGLGARPAAAAGRRLFTAMSANAPAQQMATVLAMWQGDMTIRHVAWTSSAPSHVQSTELCLVQHSEPTCFSLVTTVYAFHHYMTMRPARERRQVQQN